MEEKINSDVNDIHINYNFQDGESFKINSFIGKSHVLSPSRNAS